MGGRAFVGRRGVRRRGTAEGVFTAVEQIFGETRALDGGSPGGRGLRPESAL